MKLRFATTRLLPLLLVALLLASVAAFVPGVSGAQDPAAADENLMDVTGVGTLDVKPDTARVSLGVSTLAETAADSYAKAASAMDGVINSVKGLGIAQDNIGTSGLNLYAEYDWRDNQQILRGYRTTATVTVTVTDLSRVGPVIDAAVAVGANQLQGVQFLVKNEAAHLNNALDAAVDDAKAKADRVAARLGTAVVGVKRVSIITQGSSQPPVYYRDDSFRAEAAAAMPIMPGTQEYSVQVQVVFKLR